MALLRHGAMSKGFDRPYAPSTSGSFLRAFTFGNIRQLDAVATQQAAPAIVAQRLRKHSRGSPCGAARLVMDRTVHPSLRTTKSDGHLTTRPETGRPKQTQWTLRHPGRKFIHICMSDPPPYAESAFNHGESVDRGLPDHHLPTR